MSIARAKIFEPALRLYDRPVHPEFLRIVSSKTVQRSDYELTFSITDNGHLISWTNGKLFLTEVLTANIRELPAKPLFRHPILPSETEKIQRGCYHNQSSIETLPFDFFIPFAEEFIDHLEPDGLLFRFGLSGRTPFGGISYIGTESRTRKVIVQAVHTFPDDAVLLKTESVFCR